MRSYNLDYERSLKVVLTYLKVVFMSIFPYSVQGPLCK